MKKRFSAEYSLQGLGWHFPPVSFAVSMLFLMQPLTSMDYLLFASTESGFGLLLTSIQHQENLCPNG